MRPRSLLVLLLAALGLGAFIYFYERHLPSSDERRQQAKKVLALAASEVEAVEISWDAQQVRLEQRRPPAAAAEGAAPAPPAWHLGAPFDVPADGPAVDRLVTALVELGKRRTVDGADRVQLGLEPARARVRLVTAEGGSTLLVGDELPGSTSRAVAVEGRPEVYVAAFDLFAELTRPPGDWRARELFSGSRYDLAAVDLEVEGRPALRLVRLADGDDFRLEDPGGALADLAAEERVEELASELAGLRIAAFLDPPQPPPAALGLAPAATAVAITFQDGRPPLRLELGAPVPEGAGHIYGRRGEQLFTVATELPALARRPLDEWRSLAWASLASYQVDRVELRDAAGELVLERYDEGWHRGEETLDFTPVSDLLFAVSELRGERLLTPAEVAVLPAEPLVTLVLGGEGERRETLTLFPFTDALGDGAAVRSSERPVALRVSAQRREEILGRLGAVRLAPAQEPPPAVEAP